jgi:hypothetical protein
MRRKVLRTAHEAASAMVERLLTFLDKIEGDAVAEPSLAVPETEWWGSQEKTWRGACRSRLRNKELEFEADTRPECDREEDDEPGGDIDTTTDVMQSDFTGGESIDQTRLSYGYGDGEANLASLEQIDQRRLWWGSRTDHEVDDFRDKEADELDTKECGWDDLCEGEEPGFEG